MSDTAHGAQGAKGSDAAADLFRRAMGSFWALDFHRAEEEFAATARPFPPPALAGAAMALSSVSVVTNALTLTRWRPPGLPVGKRT